MSHGKHGRQLRWMLYPGNLRNVEQSELYLLQPQS